MNDKIINLEDMKPHISIQGFKSIHICPLSMFQEIIDGNLFIGDVEDINDFMPSIIKEWLGFLDE